MLLPTVARCTVESAKSGPFPLLMLLYKSVISAIYSIVVRYSWFTTMAALIARSAITITTSAVSPPATAKKRTESSASGKSVYAGQRSAGSGRTVFTARA